MTFATRFNSFKSGAANLGVMLDHAQVFSAGEMPAFVAMAAARLMVNGALHD